MVIERLVNGVVFIDAEGIEVEEVKVLMDGTFSMNDFTFESCSAGWLWLHDTRSGKLYPMNDYHFDYCRTLSKGNKVFLHPSSTTLKELK